MANEPSDSSGLEDIRPERRFLLFQLDVADPALKERLVPRWVSPSGRPDLPIAISDYSDYDNVRSDIYWRDRLQNSWQQRFEDDFNQFAADLCEQVNIGTVALRRYFKKQDPYVDLSPFVVDVSGYSVVLGDLSNSITITLARPDTADDSIEFAGAALSNPLNLFDGILPRENDILMVLVRYPGKLTFTREYIGYVTRLEQDGAYGKTDKYVVTAEGVSKLMKLTEVIRQQSVSKNLFIPNIEVNEVKDTSVFSDNYNDKDVRHIFENVVHEVLAIGSSDSNRLINYPSVAYTRGYTLDPRPFIPKIIVGDDNKKSVEFINGGFQHNFFALLTIFLMTLESAFDEELFPVKPNPDPASAQYYTTVKKLREDAGGDTDVPEDDADVILSPVDRAFLDHGDNAAFNLMVATGFELFYPHLTPADEILAEIRNTAFYDIFENRLGQLVCRPGRYNKIEITNSESERDSAENIDSDTGISSEFLFVKKIVKNSKNSDVTSWEFNPEADFFISDEDIVEGANRIFDDSDLDSRVDVKLSMPMVGSPAGEFPASSYTDPDVLLRFGLKTKGPMENPNALNATAPIIFAPLALAMSNAQARTLGLTVKDARHYYIGKLYYIEALDVVGFLTEDSVPMGYGQIGTRELKFSMVRNVVRRPFSEILTKGAAGTYNEAMNLAMCYMDDPPDSKSGTVKELASKLGLPSTVKNTKDIMIEKGLKLATAMNAQSTGDATVVMFRYIPSILDIALEVEANPSIAKRDPNVAGSEGGSTNTGKNAASDARIKAGVLGDALALSFGFTKSENKQSYDQTNFNIIPPIARTFEGQFFTQEVFRDDPANPGNVLSSDVIISPAASSAEAPFWPAGVLNYAPIADRTAAQIAPWFETKSRPSAEIRYCKTPFLTSALCAQPSNIKTSQLLVNKLASADLAMKYLPPPGTDLPQQFYSNLSGVPQLYYFDGAAFHLFAPDILPGEFFKQRALNRFSIITAFSNLISMPQCISLNLNVLDEFSSKIDPTYRIVGNGRVFRMPYGHFIISPNSNPSIVSQVAFIRVQSKRNSLLGGTYKITPANLPGDFIITPQDADSILVLEDGNNRVIGAGQGINITVPLKELYFISPYAEPTIERLLNFPMPIVNGGQLSQEELEAIKAKLKNSPSPPSILSINNARANGNAINLSIDYLAAASKSDLEAFPLRLETTVVNSPSLKGIWKHFETGLHSGIAAIASFKKPDAVIPFPNAMVVGLVYPDGKVGPDRSCLVYTIQIVGARSPNGQVSENGTYAASLTALNSL